MLPFYSDFFQLEEIRDGIYVAVVKPGTGALGNAAVVDFGDFCVVFDTFLSPRAALDLKQFIDTHVKLPVRFVINSHMHVDHVCGNQVFDGAVILATETTRSAMGQISGGFVEYARQNPDFPQSMVPPADKVMDDVLRQEMLRDAADFTEFANQAANITLTLPEVTFTNEMSIHGSKRTATLISYGGGHTASDAMLYLPEDEVILMGDLLAVDNHVQFKFGNIHEWIRILDQVQNLSFKTAAPGHGPVGSPEDVQKLRTYLEHIVTHARDLYETSTKDKEFTLDDLTFDIPSDYADWSARSLYARNVKQVLDGFLKTGTGSN